jgi:hypothetical protein
MEAPSKKKASCRINTFHSTEADNGHADSRKGHSKHL